MHDVFVATCSAVQVSRWKKSRSTSLTALLSENITGLLVAVSTDKLLTRGTYTDLVAIGITAASTKCPSVADCNCCCRFLLLELTKSADQSHRNATQSQAVLEHFRVTPMAKLGLRDVFVAH